jgi:hypothetical protein
MLVPKLAKDITEPFVQGPVTEWRGELDGYTTSLVTVEEDVDLAPLLRGLPDDKCPSPHWGFVFRGDMWWRFDDREEIVHAGEAFCAPPGHASGAHAGSEFLVFSPTEIMAKVEDHSPPSSRTASSSGPWPTAGRVCDRLGLPVPDEAFPWTSTTGEFRAHNRLDFGGPA